jgi:hypothetical protein
MSNDEPALSSGQGLGVNEATGLELRHGSEKRGRALPRPPGEAKGSLGASRHHNGPFTVIGRRCTVIIRS